MKVALIVPNNVWFCPYITIYTELLQRLNIEYNIISWNRDGHENNDIQYEYCIKSRNRVSLTIAYWKFARFVRKKLQTICYDKVIVFTPQSAIFLSRYLKRRYPQKYVFDFRDLSIEQKKLFKRPFKRVLRYSYINVISSTGFLKYLPTGFKYILSHNFNINDAKNAVESREKVIVKRKPIEVLTIGGIRDYESNAEVINELVNRDDIVVKFVGKGPSASDLMELSTNLLAKNIYFEGYYPKEKEKEYILDSTFLNIYYPRKPSHDSALSNRFYNSLIYKRPMITTKDTTQGNYTSKYNIGIAINNCDNLAQELMRYLDKFDPISYEKSCNSLLKQFIDDYHIWEDSIYSFISK